MDPIESLHPGESGRVSSSCGELIVQNGRQTGARRPLVTPLTLIGRAVGCDVRLNVEGVSPHHCAIIPGPNGPVLRDLHSDTGVRVNDEAVTSCLLKDGDVVTVGPFRLAVQGAGAQSDDETDALRVQAAAVAAQQAALIEEESRLAQRRCALEKQEEQLSAHLEERRQELVGLKEQVKQQRTQLQLERANLDQERRDRLSEAERDRAEAAQLLAREKQERQRLWELRRRLRKRWKKHWQAQEQAILAREKAVEKRQQGFAAEQSRLEVLRADLVQSRLKLNGERELTRRQLQDEREQLKQARLGFQIEKQRQERHVAAESKRLSEEEKTLQQSRQALEGWRQQAQMMRDQLVRESEGLEARVLNLRQVLGQLEAKRGAAVQPVVSAAPVAPLDGDVQRWLSRLEIVAGVLADQRLLLVDQWQCFLEAQEQWRRKQAELLPQLEETAHRLQEREAGLDDRERSLQALAQTYRERQEALAALRLELEAAQSRGKMNESDWLRERSTLLVRVDRAEEIMRRCQERLNELRGQWTTRRKDELARLKRELHKLRELQRLYTTLREECDQRALELTGLQKSLAERSLAVEQLELERLGQSQDSVAAEKRVHKLQRQYANQYEEMEQRLGERGRSLEAEAARLEAQSQQLSKRLEAAAENEALLSARQTEWEHRLAKEEQTREELQQRIEELQRQEEKSDRRAKELQEELDRLVALLLRDEDSSAQALAA